MTQFFRVLPRLPALILLPFLISCDVLAPTAEGGPGAFEVRLLSPAGDEGAALFQLTGGEGLGLASATEGRVFSHPSAENVRVVAIMEEPGEIRFRITTEDVAKFPAVVVLEVADGENRLRESLAEYRVRIRKIKGRSLVAAGGGA